MPSGKTQPILVIRKKAGHAAHHGGAWKVAYADFVTALMSLFIVLWLMNSSEKIRKAVAGYFNDPKGTSTLMGTTLTGTGETIPVATNASLQDLKNKLEQEIQANQELQKLSKQIEITVTPEGLRIEMLEDRNGTFYDSGSAHLSEQGQTLLALLAKELKTLPNNLLIEGHTDAAQYSSDADYSNWELSADRANAARRLLQAGGVRRDQVTQVRGYADQLLRVKDNPYDPSNRRVSIVVKNLNKPVSAQNTAGTQAVTQRAGGAPVHAANTAKAQNPAPIAPVKSAAPASQAAAARPGFLDKIRQAVPGMKK